MSKPAARRAARFGLPFSPPVSDPELETYYFAQLEKFGKNGHVFSPPSDVSVLFLDENPDSAWKEIGHHFLSESVEYGRWQEQGLQRPLEMNDPDIKSLRDARFYEIITPEECLQRHLDDDSFYAVIHPLVGGMPLERGWHCMELYAEKVLPNLL